MDKWEAAWEIAFAAGTLEELLIALVVRDLVHGASFDVEAEADGTELALDFFAGDELDGESYHLLLSAEIGGEEKPEMVREFTEQMLEQMIDESEELVERKTELGSRSLDELVFRAVPEDEERWDLVIPDWLAPDGAEVPFGFRSYVVDGDEAWPSDGALDEYGRVILVPFAGTAHLFGIPAPAEPEDEEDPNILPVHQ
ncbi:MAG: hypothetical protein P8Y93_04505 [Acidobacteriota bacterium]